MSENTSTQHMKRGRPMSLRVVTCAAAVMALLGTCIAHADEPGVSALVCQELALGYTPAEIIKQLEGSPSLNAYHTVWDAIHEGCCPVIHWGCFLR